MPWKGKRAKSAHVTRIKYPSSCFFPPTSTMSSILLVLLQLFGLPLLVKRAVNFAVDFSDDCVRRLLFCLPCKPVAVGLPSVHAYLAHCPLRDNLVSLATCPSILKLPCRCLTTRRISPHAPWLWSSSLRLRSSPSHWIDKNFIIILCSQLTSFRQNVLVRRFARFTSGLTSYKNESGDFWLKYFFLRLVRWEQRIMMTTQSGSLKS